MVKIKNNYNYVNVNIRLPKNEVEKIRNSVENGDYLNTSDFCRTAIREKLKKTRVVDIT